jgi:hypothetical protein
MLPDGSRRARIPFSTLGNLDLTAVERIELELFRVGDGQQFILKSFATIPEPTAGVPFALGLCGCLSIWRLPSARSKFVS